MTLETSTLLDDVGRAILMELQADARLSLAELGRRVSLSAPAVAERLRRMEEAGIIQGYTARVDPTRIGYGLVAFVRINVDGPTGLYSDKVTAIVRGRQEFVECHHLTGDDCFLVKLVARDPAHLEELIGQLAEFGRTTTSLVLSSPVPQAPISPPPPAG